jgi:hypothetical protein
MTDVTLPVRDSTVEAEARWETTDTYDPMPEEPYTGLGLRIPA